MESQITGKSLLYSSPRLTLGESSKPCIAGNIHQWPVDFPKTRPSVAFARHDVIVFLADVMKTLPLLLVCLFTHHVDRTSAVDPQKFLVDSNAKRITLKDIRIDHVPPDAFANFSDIVVEYITYKMYTVVLYFLFMVILSVFTWFFCLVLPNSSELLLE